MKTLVFAPHAGIWVHAFPEALIADALRSAGDELVYVTCGGALGSFCITMGAHGLTPSSPPSERMAVCRRCRLERRLLRGAFRFAGYDFDSVLDAADEIRIASLLDETDAATVMDFTVDGVAVGRATLYEYLIQHKKTRVDPAQWPEVRDRLANTLRALFAAQRICEREQPERVLTYNSLYSVNAMWRAVADRRGAASYFLHAGSNLDHRLQTMIVARDSPLAWSRNLIALWPQYRDQPITTDEAARIVAHFEQLLRGTSVFAYSAAASSQRSSIRDRFGVQPRQKLVVVAMSSYDEYVAAAAIGEMPGTDGQLFPTQIAWETALARWFAARPELFLIIRVHPREFPNKREGTKSEHATALERALAELPPNVAVNWPSDQLSIYDVAEHADAFLIAWSSAGKEMALLGLPVVTFCPEMLLYPADLNYVGTTESAYFAAIEDALRDGWSAERSRRALRWWVLELERAVAHIGDGYAFREQAPTRLLPRVRRLPVVRESLDVLERPRHLRAEAQIADAIHGGAAMVIDPPRAPSEIETIAETAALRGALASLVRAMYGRDTSPVTPGTLRAKLSAFVGT